MQKKTNFFFQNFSELSTHELSGVHGIQSIKKDGSKTKKLNHF